MTRWEGTKYQKQFEEYKNCVSQLIHHYPKIQISWIQGQSQSSQVVKGLQKIVAKTGIDYLFIDGSHNEEDVLEDWQKYKDLVNVDGLACFHDVFGEEGVHNAFIKIINESPSIYLFVSFNKPGVPLLVHATKEVKLGMGFVYQDVPKKGLPSRVKNYLNPSYPPSDDGDEFRQMYSGKADMWGHI